MIVFIVAVVALALPDYQLDQIPQPQIPFYGNWLSNRTCCPETATLLK
jgi:hypothetical protein